MNKAFEKLKKNDLVFTLMFVTFGFLPILLKLILTGSIGPTFEFYFFILWIPVITLSFSLLRGWRVTAFASISIVSAFVISLLTYPLDPTMDFRRQIVQQLDQWIILAGFASWGFQVVIPRLKNNETH